MAINAKLGQNKQQNHDVRNNMNNDIFEKLKAIAVNDIGIDADKIKPESVIIEDLGLDSLDMVDMLMKVEETFGVTIDDGDVAEMRTVADVVDFIEGAIA